MNSHAHIGVTGLAVMGRNLARNFARHGYTVAVHTGPCCVPGPSWRSSVTRPASYRPKPPGISSMPCNVPAAS
ncbi:NAD(P)-binding domain-containing protein [Streptomyces clavifer]|uniref:NAD(P)-binding domain-containing protein n=1 Tax=Streptomyces clavifer TaxID=68188 RepID=UPI00382B8ABC